MESRKSSENNILNTDSSYNIDNDLQVPQKILTGEQESPTFNLKKSMNEDSQLIDENKDLKKVPVDDSNELRVVNEQNEITNNA